MNQKTVLITGSTRGIGLAFVEHYHRNGWKVIAAARNLDNAERLKALAPYKVIQLDAGNEASILEAANELQGEPIDLLINNAGIGVFESLETVTKASLMDQFEVNAAGPFLVTRALLPNLRAAVAINGSAVVGQLSSYMGSITENCIGGLHSGSNHGYRASKAALNMLNANLAVDLEKHKIIAIALHPGYVATDMTSHAAGAISTEESVEGMSKVLAGVTLGDSGKFLQNSGAGLGW